MSMRISPITAQLGRLSISSIPSRLSTQPAHTITTTAAAAAKPKETTKTTKKREKKRTGSPFEPEHGEKIFVFSHILEGMTVYSHSPVLKPSRAMRQIPFNGKKKKPQKIRKDYWGPIAMIQFPEGQGEVGRSVFQRLRECKKLHEYAWGDEQLYDDRGRTMTVSERGRSLNDQRANTIADMAAVLGGLGKGNKIVLGNVSSASSSSAAAAEGEGNGGETVAEGSPALPVAVDEGKTLLRAVVWWADALDRNYAKRWPKNVTHQVFDKAVLEPIKGNSPAEAAEGEEAGATQSPA